MLSFNSYGEWSKVTTSIDENTFYIEVNTIREKNGYVYFWELVDYVIPLIDLAYSAKNYIVTDCNLNSLRYKYLRDIYYSKPMLKGSIIDSSDIPDTEWRYVGPESVFALELKSVCDFAN